MTFAPENENPIQFTNPVGGEPLTEDQKRYHKTLEPQDYNGIRVDDIPVQDEFDALDEDGRREALKRIGSLLKNYAAQHGGIKETFLTVVFHDGHELKPIGEDYSDNNSIYAMFHNEYIKMVCYQNDALIVPIEVYEELSQKADAYESLFQVFGNMDAMVMDEDLDPEELEETIGTGIGDDMRSDKQRSGDSGI